MKYNVVTPCETPGADKPTWHKIGKAWDGDDGKIVVLLQSLPFRSPFIYLMPDDRSAPKKDGAGK